MCKDFCQSGFGPRHQVIMSLYVQMEVAHAQPGGVKTADVSLALCVCVCLCETMSGSSLDHQQQEGD